MEKARVVNSPIIQEVLDGTDPQQARIIELEMEAEILKEECEYWKTLAIAAGKVIHLLAKGRPIMRDEYQTYSEWRKLKDNPPK